MQDLSQQPQLRFPRMGELGDALRFGAICRAVACPPPPPVIQPFVQPMVPQVPIILQAPVPRTDLVKLSQYVGQDVDGECEPMDTGALSVAYQRYTILFGGTRGLPPPHKKPSPSQLAAVKHIAMKAKPYVDFAIFGPYAERSARKIRLSGWTFDSNGVLRQTEIFGPPNLDAWVECYEVFETTCFMLEIIDMGPLIEYKSQFVNYCRVYDPRGVMWPFMYQQDTRARNEQLE